MQKDVLIIILIITFGTLFFIAYFVSQYRSKYTSSEKKKMVNENVFISNNKDKLEKIFDEKYGVLKPIKMNILYSSIAFVIFIALSFVIKDEIFTYVSLGITLVFLFVNIYNYRNKSYDIYNEIVKEVLHDFDSDLEYNPSGGFTENEYDLCRFPEDNDFFYSEDLIVNAKKDFQYADVLVKSEHTDRDGDTYYSTEFEGSLAKIGIKDIGCKIFLGGIKAGSIFKRDDYIGIKFENDEFNDLFMAYSDNEIQAYKVLTPDVMEEFVNIKKTALSDIDIRILNNKLYVRFLSGDGFDSSTFSESVDKSRLCQSIAVLEDIMKTMERVKMIIEKKNYDY